MFGGVTDNGQGLYQGGFGSGPEKQKLSFAWAAHAGLGYSITPNLKLELAYRYLNMGSAQTGTITCDAPPFCKTDYHLRTLPRMT